MSSHRTDSPVPAFSPESQQSLQISTPLDLAALERSHPGAAALIRECLAMRQPRYRDPILQAYGGESQRFFDQMEAEIGWITEACSQDLVACLQELRAFNSLTPETENDTWYDQPAAFSSMHLDALVIGFARRRMECLVAHLQPLGVIDAAVLEVGSGCGLLAAMLLEINPAWKYLLVDRSAAATTYATQYLRARKLDSRAFCQTGDLTAIPAPDISADIVIAAEVLEHADDPRQCVAELRRVLKPGGYLAVSVPIDLDIGMHPTVFRTPDEIAEFIGGMGFCSLKAETVRPDPTLDAIAEVFPGFEGCLHATFRKE